MAPETHCEQPLKLCLRANIADLVWKSFHGNSPVEFDEICKDDSSRQYFKERGGRGKEGIPEDYISAVHPAKKKNTVLEKKFNRRVLVM